MSGGSRLWLKLLLKLPILLLILLLLQAGRVGAEPLLVKGSTGLTGLPGGSLGLQTEVFIETPGETVAQPLDLAQAQALQRAGKFNPGQQQVLNFGIGAPPVWLRLALHNPGAQAVEMRLLAGTTWLDSVALYQLQGDKLLTQVHTGDEQAGAQGLTPVLGFVFALRLPPGDSELFLRVASVDPMLLPLELVTPGQLAQRRLQTGYFYGLVYGFLFALCVYNLLLFAGLRQRSYLYYALYLATLIAMNMAYTGHGQAWFWPGAVYWQLYIIVVLIVLFGCSGLLFAARFLALREHAPRALRAVQWFCGLGLLGMLAAVLGDWHLAATLLAFFFVTIFTFAMVGLGWLTLRQRRRAGRYFLIAALCGMVGTLVTTLSTWSVIPFKTWTFHALEVGLMFEASLLALALAFWVRQQQDAALRAEQMARLDPLTQLRNRRAFLEQAAAPWSTSLRNSRPLSLIMLDLDHFKQINDEMGHAAGDKALVKVARLLEQCCRAGDILARWGGEEFVLLMPETDLQQACLLAERLRLSIENSRPALNNVAPLLTASIGVAERVQAARLEDLINAADAKLFEAKHLGRNRVAPAQA
ncbi:sensor domain-containing diguanylate cyclase [Paucibacter sp. TC2R-5]|uniref:sensor domain-containing diguanylate cyclase n=1 Tax=Paucibacter sp. TC2R-5 TaxID=2893555 RepID=UPI0021E3B6E6|nr:diguanylate cyclase [Paucibacter sp. TC2R-5]MCV2358373.1 sensor domain-containing diguanylate cyclase [Paucibacter sp. TC2R-5]